MILTMSKRVNCALAPLHCTCELTRMYTCFKASILHSSRVSEVSELTALWRRVQTAIDDSLIAKEGCPRRWYNAVFPILSVIILVILALIMTGRDAVAADDTKEMNVEVRPHTRDFTCQCEPDQNQLADSQTDSTTW